MSRVSGVPLRAALGLAFLLGVAGAFAGPSPARWAQFRGPNGAGVCEECRPPIRFGPDLNQRWKTPVPPGHSSPVVWDDHVFMTAVEGGRLWTVALSARDGRERWRRAAPTVALEKIHSLNSPAASTPATDGQRVYVYFGSFGLLSYDFDGREQWRIPLPTPPMRHGTSTSPIVTAGKVILQRDGNSPESEVLAVDGRTGAIAWRAARPLLRESYATPMIWAHGGVEELITVSNGRVVAHDPRDGTERWWASGVTFQPVTLAVAGESLLFVSSSGVGTPQEPLGFPTWPDLLRDHDANRDGRLAPEEVPEDVGIHTRKEVPREVPGNFIAIQRVLKNSDDDKDGLITKAEWEGRLAFVEANANNVMALRPGGRGDVTRTHVAWKAQTGIPELPSPLFYRGRLWFVRNGGMVTSYEAATGRVILDRRRLDAGGQYAASLIGAAGHIFAASEPGVISVFQASDTLAVVGRADLGERIFATPALVGDTLYVRTEGHAWAFRSGSR
jgi:outer membrane protein assembly factor BamB